MTRLKALLLDIDGTLVDSNDLHTRAWLDAFAHFGRPFEYDFMHTQMGKGGDLLVPDLLSARDIQEFGEELKKWRKEHFAQRYLPEVKPFPGVREAMRTLHDDGLKLVLASSSDKDEVEHYTQLLGVAELIEAKTSKADAAHSKPYPEIFEVALEQSGVQQREALVVGDTPYDILAAHRSAIAAAALRSGKFSDGSLQKAEFLFDDLGEMVRRIDEVHAYFAGTA